MKTIPLTQGKVTLVDDEDYEELNRYKWHAHSNSYTFYARRNVPIGNGKRTTILMHRVILGIPPGILVDHWDHNGLNNQRINLRTANRPGNSQNRLNQKDTTTGYKGVTIDEHRRQRKIYRARITAEGRQIFLGGHATPEEAARVYDEAARRFHGEFACLNFPREEGYP